MAMKQSVPQHIGIIMDGNRRWARERGVPTLKGHAKGYEQAVRIAEHAFERGVSYLTLYAFSTENWNRSKAEVGYLMRLLKRLFSEKVHELHERNIRVRVIGSSSRVAPDIVRDIHKAEALTAANTAGTLIVAFNYGGRAEIIEAVEKLLHSGKRSSISERAFEQHLSTAGVPDPDLIIRTSGEQRLSGFLLWQSAYSELYFMKKYWPDFTEKDLDRAIDEYSTRKRRFGK